MIEDVDAQVRDWLAGAAGEAAISFALPSDAVQRLTLFAYLFEIERPQAVPSGRTPPIQLRLGYLLTAAGPDPIAAHAVLSAIIVAADTQVQYSIEFGAPAAAAWARLGLPARAALVLRATAKRERAGSPAPPVRSARIDTVPIVPVSGRVVSADGTPLAGAAVAIASLGRTATTDAQGHFTIEGATDAVDLVLHVRAKDRDTEVRRSPSSAHDSTIVVDIP